MDYFNLSTEYNSLTSYTKNGIQSLSNFLSFLKNIYKYSEQFVLNSKSSLDQFITQFLNEGMKWSLFISGNFLCIGRRAEDHFYIFQMISSLKELWSLKPTHLDLWEQGTRGSTYPFSRFTLSVTSDPGACIPKGHSPSACGRSSPGHVLSLGQMMRGMQMFR